MKIVLLIWLIALNARAEDCTTNTGLAQFSSVPALKSASGVEGQRACVAGYWSPGDGAGGEFTWNSNSVVPDNRGIHLMPNAYATSATPGRWVRAVTNADQLNLRWFGAQFSDSPSTMSATGRENFKAFQGAFQYLRTLDLSSRRATVFVPAGHYYVHFENVADNLNPYDSTSGWNSAVNALSASKLLVVPPNTTICGQVGASTTCDTTTDLDVLLQNTRSPFSSIPTGASSTFLLWKVTAVPLFLFVSSSHSSLRDMNLIFNGALPHYFPWSTDAIVNATSALNPQPLAIDPSSPTPTYEPKTFRYVGTAYAENSAAIYAVNSEYLVFNNLRFDLAKGGASTAADGYGYAFNLKGMIHPTDASGVPLPWSGVGLGGRARFNQITNIQFRGAVQEILAAGQKDFVVQNITSNQRGSWLYSYNPAAETHTDSTGTAVSLYDPVTKTANCGEGTYDCRYLPGPGHVLYMAGQLYADTFLNGTAQWKTYVDSECVHINNIWEGAVAPSVYNSLGTLAIKDVNNLGTERDGTSFTCAPISGAAPLGVSNVTSYFPTGMMQSAYNIQGVDFRNLYWEAREDLTASTTRYILGGYTNSNINIIGNDGNCPGLSDNTRQNSITGLTLKNPYHTVRIAIGGSYAPKITSNVTNGCTEALTSYPITVDGLTIQNLSILAPIQSTDAKTSFGFVSVDGANSVVLQNFMISPLSPVTTGAGSTCTPPANFYNGSSNGSIAYKFTSTVSQSCQLPPTTKGTNTLVTLIP